jgi:DNA-binding MarR family transcriptional regulator
VSQNKGEQNRGLTTIVLDPRDVQEAKRLLGLLSSGDTRSNGADSTTAFHPDTTSAPTKFLNGARRILSHRQKRYAVFGKAMFGEPAWDIMLWLYVLQYGERPTISRLGELAGTSKSTALRWIDYLESQRWISRAAHPTDKRAVFVDVTESGRAAVELYLTGTLEP